MYLKRIEAFGFKSFANRVVFDLSEGITGFVGPNGCGKSNVVDAVKWGLGEQRISTLRGDSMQDVLFKGNGQRPPMNIAEVTLVFSNACGTLPIDFNEVVVTRRLYRSGESEYLLNRTACRLKDIKTLFLDTGVGVSAYSMMEQGRIDSILQTDPVSRRAIFEEASGISRFKTRRKEAERKLERTQANLLRLGDIIDELEKRIRSLKNQAGRARSYVKLSDRLKELKTAYFLYMYGQLSEEEGRIKERKGAVEAACAAFSETLGSEKEGLETIEKEMVLLGEEFHAQKTSLAEAKTSLEETQGKIGYFERRVVELEKEGVDTEERLRALKQGLEEKERDRAGIETRFEAIEAEQKGIEEEADRCLREAQALSTACRESRTHLDGLESRAFELTRSEVALKNQAVEAETQLRGQRKESSRLARRQCVLSSSLFEVNGAMARIDGEINRIDTERSGLTARLEQGEGAARSTEEALRAVDEKMRRLESALIKGESRIEALQDLIDRREGVSIGVKDVLKEAQAEGSTLSFVKGMLGELLEVGVDHSAALEAALGETAQALVVDDLGQAARIIDFLRSKESGRVQIMPLSALQGFQAAKPSGNGSLSHHVVGSLPEIQEAVTALLGEVHIVTREDLVKEGKGQAYKSVTMQGDWVDRFGVLSVGGVVREPGVISRRSELAALTAEGERLSEEIKGIQTEREGIAATLDEVTRKNRGLLEEIESLNKVVAGLEARRDKDLERRDLLRREFRLNAQEGFDAERATAAMVRRIARFHGEMAKVREELETITEAFNQAQAEYEQQRTRQEGLEQKSREFELKRAQVRERREGMITERHLIERSLNEVKERMEDLKGDRARIESTRVDMEAQLDELKERAQSLLAKRSALSQSVIESERRLEEERSLLDGRKEGVVKVQTDLEDARRNLDDLRVDERENQVRREALVEKAREELHIELAGAGDESLHAAAAGLFEGAEGAPDWEAVELEIRDIKDRLSRMGNVNLDAISELEAVEERFESLSTQREDLIRSIKSLEDLIVDLNRESRQKFLETFEKVRGHFSGIFRKLFQGGKADVRLREGEDVLEAGIEIIAGPPGKDPQSISLLSGGERTLTAVGLLFALFKSRPSPFCILDEVDAALDEVNIERFCTLLGEFVGGSQFMIVTHSKRTMSYCNFLYGITMQEDGITTRVPLNLEEYEDRVA